MQNGIVLKMTVYAFLPCVGARVRSTVDCATSVWWILIITASGWTTASVQRTTGQLNPSIFISIMWIITNLYLFANPFFSHRWFIATISSAFLGAVMMLLYNTALFILYFAGRDNLRYDCNFPSNSSACNETLRIFGTAMPDAVFPVLTAILGILALIAVVLVGHLTVFHFYLSKHRCFQYQVLCMLMMECPLRNTRSIQGSFHIWLHCVTSWERGRHQEWGRSGEGIPWEMCISEKEGS